MALRWTFRLLLNLLYIRDSNGSPIVVGAHNPRECAIYVDEPLALRDALRFAKVESFKKSTLAIEDNR
ncbi:hypothetical protein DVH24_025714 [Malus domestica]|uniref:Uncharacterized protein n=1 Tax=Malus domestica TaxID=3750 RepID=A0A498KG06_MALDO|nr:hypothetical protein DVH24_025714 [Malus domestica]